MSYSVIIHCQDFKQSNEVSYLKFLVSNAEAGAVIGKGGSIISDLRLQSETFIQLSNNYEFFPGTANRIILVSGQIDCVIKAVELILEKFRNEVPKTNSFMLAIVFIFHNVLF